MFTGTERFQTVSIEDRRRAQDWLETKNERSTPPGYWNGSIRVQGGFRRYRTKFFPLKSQRKLGRAYNRFIPVKVEACHWRPIVFMAGRGMFMRHSMPGAGWRFDDGHPVDLTKMEFARGRGAVRRVFAREKL